MSQSSPQLHQLHQRLAAVEVAQQLLAVQLRELQPDVAKRMAVALENLAASNKLAADPHVKTYLGHLARLLSAMGYPIIGLNRPPLDADAKTDTETEANAAAAAEAWFRAYYYDSQ